jgi:hypothetical protein
VLAFGRDADLGAASLAVSFEVLGDSDGSTTAAADGCAGAADTTGAACETAGGLDETTGAAASVGLGVEAAEEVTAALWSDGFEPDNVITSAPKPSRTAAAPPAMKYGVLERLGTLRPELLQVPWVTEPSAVPACSPDVRLPGWLALRGSRGAVCR